MRGAFIALAALVSVVPVAPTRGGELDPPGAPEPTGVSLGLIGETGELSQRFTLFQPDGAPIRAAMSVMVSDGGPEIVGSDTVGALTDVIEVAAPRVQVPGGRFNGRYLVAGATHVYVVKRNDETSPFWIHAHCTGRMLDEVTIDVFRADTPVLFYQIKMERVFITSYSFHGISEAPEFPVAQEALTLSYETLQMTDPRTGTVVRVGADGSCSITVPGGP